MSSANRTTSPPLNSGDYSFGRSAGRTSPDPTTRRGSNTSPTKPPWHRPNPGSRYWKHNGRPQSPGLTWRKDYSQVGPKCGRVLVIDFLKADHSRAGARKVLAEEISDIEGLRRWYSDLKRNDEAVLRVFHVQNAWWATRFLLRKFNIDNHDDLVGTNFGRYVKSKRPERRGGKPLLTGKTWRTQHDPWRGISKTSFGLDYLKPYRVEDPAVPNLDNNTGKMMELNCFDEEDNAIYGYDIYSQRLSVYVQHKDANPEVPTDPDIRNPYRDLENGSGNAHKPNDYVPDLNKLDNGNAIIIFDDSKTGSFEDTLIEARKDWESRWRRLPFYLAYEGLRDSIDSDEAMALSCSKMILQDIWKGVVTAWDDFLDVSTTHIGILEDKIYDQPADETRAPELWMNSSQWLKVEKLMFIHIDVVKELRTRLSELTETVEDDWLDDSNGDFDRLHNLVTEDLTKPTENLIALLYQSVSIRDSRHSLQLGTSMWRLSWITFIFLPLTFIVGFFGMNVSTFKDDPSIKWYFVAVVPFMILVLIIWYILKHILARQRQTPYQRGIYETFFHDMAVANPTLWSRAGPRDYIVPSSRLDKFKWFLIQRWSAPEKTIRAPNADTEGGAATPDDLGAWSRCKRALIRRWTKEIRTLQPRRDDSSSTDLEGGSDHGLLDEGLVNATEMLTVPYIQTAVGDDLPTGLLAVNPRIRIQRQLSPPGSGRARSSGSENRNSGLLVEEEDLGWLSEMGKQGKGWWRPASPGIRGMRSGSRSDEEGKRKKQSDKDEGSRTASDGSVRRSEEGARSNHGAEGVEMVAHAAFEGSAQSSLEEETR